jgi:hypothetical protein
MINCLSALGIAAEILPIFHREIVADSPTQKVTPLKKQSSHATSTYNRYLHKLLQTLASQIAIANWQPC